MRSSGYPGGSLHRLGAATLGTRGRSPVFDKSLAMTRRKRPLLAVRLNDSDPQPLEYQTTNEDLTASAGLGPVLDLFLEHPLFAQFVAALPPRLSNASYATETYAVLLIAGFLYGYDCLDDLEQFQENPLITERFGEVPSARAFGDWLRAFEPEHLERLSEFILAQARFARRQIDPQAALVHEPDSTSHVQHGVKLEGLAYDYEGRWCLSSLCGSDELGFSHAMELRAGNVFSSVGGASMMAQVFSHLKHGDPKFCRADSAFCTQEWIEEAVRQGAVFTVTAHGNTGWEGRVGEIVNWKPWEWTSEELQDFTDKKEAPPRIELGSMLYRPGWSQNLRFYVVVKRTWQQDPVTKEDRWSHYGVITNFDLFRNSLQFVMEFHNKRDNGENVIKEHKYAFDLKHFPCKKLSANQAYASLALVAHNHLRTIALLDNREHPLYAKRLRFKLICHPGKIVRHARKVFLKITERLGREVRAMFIAWAATRESALARAG